MNRLARYNVIGQIALKLRAQMNTTGINVFLGGFGVPHGMVDIVPSKQVYVQELLAKSSDAVVLEIARELQIPVPNNAIGGAADLADYLADGGHEAASEDFDRALRSVSTDAEQALGSASSMLESISKMILDHFGEPFPRDQSLQPLLKAVYQKLRLSPDGHADPDIRRLLGGLLSAAVGVGVLRTKYSGFHGKSGEQKRRKLTERHARLAVNASATIGLFLIETYRERFAVKAK